MAKAILLYGQIWEYQVEYFYEQIKEAQEDDPEAELEILINCVGGNPGYGMSLIRKAQELEAAPLIVEGMAHSMALFLLAYVPVERVSAIDTAQFVLHRASYGEWYEQSTAFKGSIEEKILVKTNKDLEKAFRARVDVAVLEALPQFTERNLKLRDIFSLESREEVLLTAQDMKKLGLVNDIIKVTPSRIAAIKTTAEAFKDCKTIEQFRLAAQTIQAKPKLAAETKPNDYMDLNELKTKYPALYAQVKAEGHAEGLAAGISQEKDRVESIMVFNHLDPEACKKAIEEGKPLSAKQMAEFQLKAISNTKLETIKKDSAGKVETDKVDPEKTEEQKKLEAFEKSARAHAGLKISA
jgi:ATP-dependent protease ClpP protease subunit